MFLTADPIAFFHLSLAPRGVRTPPSRPPHPASARLWWTVEQVAAEFGVCEETVRRWIHKGKLTAKRVGKGLRIHRFAVTAMLDKDPVGPQPPKRQRGGQVKVLPPPWVRQLREERERYA